jgi:PAS domain-containing protein
MREAGAPTIRRMDMRHPPVWVRWQQAVEAGELGLWDLRPELETVHYSPPWKLRLGFPEPELADSTHFWRCRVHPADLEPMLAAMREHARGARPHYEARFRLRSNGSGYRLMHSRGLIIERGPEGRALRMVGTMLDLTDRAPTPQGGLADGPRGLMEGAPLALPLHRLLADAQDAKFTRERERVLGLMHGLLQATLA